jgi:hypothetical protein
MHEDTRKWAVEGMLLEKVRHWKEEEMMKREGEEQRLMGKRFSGDSMDVDEEDTLEDVTDSEVDKNDAVQHFQFGSSIVGSFPVPTFNRPPVHPTQTPIFW